VVNESLRSRLFLVADSLGEGLAISEPMGIKDGGHLTKPGQFFQDFLVGPKPGRLNFLAIFGDFNYIEPTIHQG
jgi:hypothetical protein